MRWAVGGVLAGALLAVVLFAPARWLAAQLASATGGRVQLVETQGTVWHGSGVFMLTAGAQSRDASALPGRLNWRAGLHGTLPVLRLTHACCIDGELGLLLEPGFQRMRLSLLPPPSVAATVPAQAGDGGRVQQVQRVPIGHWPASLLMGLGAPWNTLRISGSLQLVGQGLSLEAVSTGLALVGQADLLLSNAASRVSSLDPLGDYVLSLQGNPSASSANASSDANSSNANSSNATATATLTTVQLRTTRGPLQLNGDGQIVGSKLRFNGQASAAPGFEAVLNNLLNILGRRQGALSVLSIG